MIARPTHLACVLAIASALLLWGEPATAEVRTIVSGQLHLTLDEATGELHAIRRGADGPNWLLAPVRCYSFDKRQPVATRLSAIPRAENQIALQLELVNQSDQPVTIAPSFPQLRGILPADTTSSELRYAFPARSARIDTAVARLRGYYGGIFPLQFMAVDAPGQGCLFIRLEDQQAHGKLNWLDKTEAQIDLGMNYLPRTLGPGERWQLPPAVIGVSDGDWHAGFHAYRQWMRSLRQPATERKAWFRNAFNFRVQFLHFAQPEKSAIFNAETKQWNLEAVLEEDRQHFGGVDFLHLFDWGWTPDHGRVGDYRPWDYLGGVDVFRAQVERTQAASIPVGLYFEGYLLSSSSDIGRRHGAEWQILDADGKPDRRWGDYYHVSPYVPAWQQYLAERVAEVIKETGARGVYLDQLGFGHQYTNHNPAHRAWQAPGESMLRGELQLARRVRQAIPDDVAIYVEETPADVFMFDLDGAYSGSVRFAQAQRTPGRINLTRFAVPDFKTFELISENGLHDNCEAVQLSFYNGQGLYLPGIATRWYSAEVLAEIRKTHHLLHQYADCFTSLEPEPLVPTLHDEVYANCFPGKGRCVWTLYNEGTSPVESECLEIPHRPGCTYWDAWNDKPLEANIQGDKARIAVPLAPGGIGCVVQQSAE